MNSPDSDTSNASLLQSLDTGGWRPIHTRILLALGLGWMLDAFEVTLVGNVLPILREQWSLSALESTLTISLWLAGILVGALAFGWLADRFGRRRLFIWTLVLYATATFATAFALNFWMFLVLRVIAAIGVGAEYSAVNAAIAELMPARRRGRAAALVMSFWPVGALLGGGLTLAVLAVAPPHIAWRIVFASGAIVAIFALWARRTLPESPRWLMSRGREAEAHAALERITGSSKATPWHHTPQAPHSAGAWFAEFKLLWQKYRARLALGAALDMSEAAGYYGLFALIPLAIIPALHLSFAGTPLFYLVGGGGALVGSLVAAWLIERVGRKATVTGFYIVTALAMMLIAVALTVGPGATLAAYVLASAVANGSWVAAYPAFAEIFPTRSRATGIGASVAAGRVAAGLSPPLLIFVAARFSVTAALILAGLFYLIGVAAMMPWIARGPEARGRTLESLAGPE
ncbi:MAG: MFS transporter [Gammaproteobacteria bacterium]